MVRALVSGEGLDLSSYIAELESYFAVSIAPHLSPDLCTLGDMATLIAQKATAAGRPIAQEAVWPEVRRITSEEFGVRENELQPSTRFVEDLCC
jgi:hypothetical protein